MRALMLCLVLVALSADARERRVRDCEFNVAYSLIQRMQSRFLIQRNFITTEVCDELCGVERQRQAILERHDLAFAVEKFLKECE